MIAVESFPQINASLNALSGICLILGYWFIKRKDTARHRVAMIAACCCSLLFLACYLWYHYHSGANHFQTQGWIRTVYLAILISHTVLAVVIVPFVILTLKRALGGNFERHRAVARYTWPMWIYVSVTGVLIYLFLYQLDPRLTPR